MSGTDWIWQTYLKALRQYAERTGSGCPPRSHLEDIDGIGDVNLGAWCAYVRRRHATNKLTQSKVADVESVPGWAWACPSPRLAEREQEMKALRAEGLTLQEIASRYGVSRQRVHAVLRKADA